VLKLIGTGAMGHVYQAEQLSLGKMVASSCCAAS
jgi:hypothetical protein